MLGHNGPEASNVNLSIGKSAVEPGWWFQRELSIKVSEAEVEGSAIDSHLGQSVT